MTHSREQTRAQPRVPMMSKDIIDGFIKSGSMYATVETEATGRSKASIYNALLGYLKRHGITQISVRLVKGDIVLVNNEKHREDAPVRPKPMG